MSQIRVAVTLQGFDRMGDAWFSGRFGRGYLSKNAVRSTEQSIASLDTREDLGELLQGAGGQIAARVSYQAIPPPPQR